MKLCKECKHHIPATRGKPGEFDKCAVAPTMVDPVAGEVIRDFGSYGYCSIERGAPFLLDVLVNACGKRARRFEVKGP